MKVRRCSMNYLEMILKKLDRGEPIENDDSYNDEED